MIYQRMALTFTYSLLIYSLINVLVYSYSACDPIDVFFIVDTATIRADSDGLIKLIDSVIGSGSNEETGFSVVIWGDNVPELKYGKNLDNDNSIVCEICETTAVHYRPKQIENMNNVLDDAFYKIRTSASDKTIDFDQALNYAKAQAKSGEREYKNRQDHGDSVGLNEDDDVFIVFDFDAVLGSNGNIGTLVEEFNDNNQQNIHFIIGEMPTIEDVNPQQEEIISDPSKAALMTRIFVFDQLVEGIGDDTPHSEWDQFLSLTCPATVEGATEDCRLGLGNHVQYVEADTILKCDLKFDTISGEMDENESILEVIDELNDESTATFKVGDYLFVDVKPTVELPPECDRIGVVRVTNIIIKEEQPENNTNILTLKIKNPDDIIEYITAGECEGVVDNHIIDIDANANERRRGLSVTVSPTIKLSKTISNKWTKTGGYTITKRKNGVDWRFESLGSAIATYSAGVEVYFGLYLRIAVGIKWCSKKIWFITIKYPCGFYFEFKTEFRAGYALRFKFNLAFEASIKLTAPRLLYFSRESLAWIGPIPVKYRPWMEIDLLIETLPMHAHAGIDCEYGHYVAIGYEYKSKGGGRGAYVNGPTPRRNSCKREWGIESGDASIPRKIALETTLDGIIGLDLYKSVSGQFIAEFKAPLHLTFTPNACNSWGPCSRNYKPAALTFQIDLQPMYAIKFNPSSIKAIAKAFASVVLSILGIKSPNIASVTNLLGLVDKSRARKIGGPIRLYTMTPQCFDIAGIVFVVPLIDKYCGSVNDCSPITAYGDWIRGNNCDECKTDSDCTNIFGPNMFCNINECECNDGYIKINDVCVDINECSYPNICGDNEQCINTPGSHMCRCKAGYQDIVVLTPGMICVDIDECCTGNNNCAVNNNALCINTPGDYRCECLPGFVGNPTVGCSDSNECANDNDNNCATNDGAVCINTPGGYRCECLPGFIGDPTIQCTEYCIISCVGRDNGNYQSCIGCDVFATCCEGMITDNRPCAPASPPLEYDAIADACVYAGQSQTCRADFYPAKSVPLNKVAIDFTVESSIVKTKNKNPMFGYISVIGVILFILINNILIAWWCLSKRNNGYSNLKGDMIIVSDNEINESDE